MTPSPPEGRKPELLDWYWKRRAKAAEAERRELREALRMARYYVSVRVEGHADRQRELLIAIDELLAASSEEHG